MCRWPTSPFRSPPFDPGTTNRKPVASTNAHALTTRVLTVWNASGLPHGRLGPFRPFGPPLCHHCTCVALGCCATDTNSPSHGHRVDEQRSQPGCHMAAIIPNVAVATWPTQYRFASLCLRNPTGEHSAEPLTAPTPINAVRSHIGHSLARLPHAPGDLTDCLKMHWATHLCTSPRLGHKAFHPPPMPTRSDQRHSGGSDVESPPTTSNPSRHRHPPPRTPDAPIAGRRHRQTPPDSIYPACLPIPSSHHPETLVHVWASLASNFAPGLNNMIWHFRPPAPEPHAAPPLRVLHLFDQC